MEYKLSEYSIYEVGQRKDRYGNPSQEDCLFPAHGDGNDQDRLFVVCDGMGGHDAGEVASATVCKAISRSVLRKNPEGDFTVEDLQHALVSAYDALDAKDTGAEKKMGTTLAMLKLFDKGYMTAHIGDSRVYHIRPGVNGDTTKIIFHTEDHSLVNAMIRRGEITVEEARVSPKRNIITRAMQPMMDYRPKADVHISSDIRPDDYFFLCSDGMIEGLTDENIRYIFSQEGGNDRNKLGLLTKYTANARDNHSAIIVHILDVIEGNTSGHTRRPGKIRAAQQRASQATKAALSKQIGKVTSRINIDPNSKLGKTAAIVEARTRDFVEKRRINHDTWRLLARLLLALMALLTVIMIAYNLWIRVDEAPPEAGHAIDGVLQEEEFNPFEEPEEDYGYETRPTTKTEDGGGDAASQDGEGIEITENFDITEGDGAMKDDVIAAPDGKPVDDMPVPEPKPAPAPAPAPTPQAAE